MKNVRQMRNKLITAIRTINEKIDIYATAVSYDIYNYRHFLTSLDNLGDQRNDLKNKYTLLAYDKSVSEETVKTAIQSYLTCNSAFESLYAHSKIISNKIAKEKVNLKKMIMSKSILDCRLDIINSTTSLDRSAALRNIDVDLTLTEIDKIVEDASLKTRAASEVDKVIMSTPVVKTYTEDVNNIYKSLRG